MDRNSKIRISFNLFDIIIILIVIALVAGFAVYQTRSSSSGGASGTKTVQYQVEITGLTEGTGDMIREGDPIVDKVKKNGMGTVVSSEFYPMTKQVVDLETGNTLYSEVPGQYSALITIEAVCSDSGTALTTDGGFVVRAGEDASIIGPGYSGGGFVVNVMRGEGDE